MIIELFVIKRDGRLEKFSPKKIEEAVKKAFVSVDGEENGQCAAVAKEIAVAVTVEMKKSKSVEEIQDIVEAKLMESDRKDVAKAYILYRNERTKARERGSDLIKAVSEKLMASNVQNQNANVDERSFGGRMGEANAVVTKQYALDYCMSEMARNNHLNNEIYIHDLSSYAVGSHNCLTIPFDKLLENGFDTRQTDIRSAGSVGTAFQLVAVIFQLQSLQQYGGVSASHIDWTMVPYVRKSFWKHYRDGLEWLCDDTNSKLFSMKDSDKDRSIDDPFWKKNDKVYRYALKMAERETMQAAEGMYHNLNTLQSRSGNQLPFTSLNYGTCTLPEGRMVIKALLENSINGTGKLHKTPIFPCGIFQCKQGVNRKPGDPNYDLFQLALKSTAQRLYPNYANVDWSGNDGYDKGNPCTYFSTMGCRTANGFDINGLGQLKDGRGNICPVTIILPTLAMEAVKKVEEDNRFTPLAIIDKVNCDDVMLYDCVREFMDLLDKKIHEAKDMLLERFELVCSQPPESAKFMYDNRIMEGYIPEEGIQSALKHGTLAVGQLGLAEALQILIGCNHTTPQGMALAKRIEALFKKRCAEFKEKYKYRKQ